MDEIIVDDLVEELSPERMNLAFYRAARKCGLDVEHNISSIALYKDLDEDELEDNEELMDAFAFELKLLVVNDMINDLVDTGEIEADHINEEGYVIYRAIS